MNRTLKTFLKKNYSLFQRIRFLHYIIISFIVKLFPTKKKRIFIASNRSDKLNDNLKYIVDEIENISEYSMKILLKKKKSNYITGLSFNIKFVFNFSISNITIIDDFIPVASVLKVKQNQKFVQVWHACGAFKKIGFARENCNKNTLTHRNYTDAIVSSAMLIEDYSKSYSISKDKVIATGIPRTDMFFDENLIKKIKQEIYTLEPRLKNKRVILFSPTFRGDSKTTAYYPKDYLDIELVYNSLNDNEVFVIKEHPFITNRIKIDSKYSDKIINWSDYPDINDILLVTDLLITDYSSVIFEYSLLNKSILFYVPDLKEYTSSRDFYYPFDKYMYGKQVCNIKELAENFSADYYNVDLANNFKNHFMDSCKGYSTKRFMSEVIGVNYED